MKSQDALQKMANDKRPVADSIERWALPDQRSLPLDTPELVKESELAFDKQAGKLSTMDKLSCARRIFSSNPDGRGMAAKLAGTRLSMFFDTFISMRKHAMAGLHEEDLSKLSAAAHKINGGDSAVLRQSGLDKIAAALDDFDREHGLDEFWDHQWPNPAYSVYGTMLNMDDPVPAERVKVANYDIGADDLDMVNWDALGNVLESEVISGMKEADDKLAIFKSLPMPHRELIAQNMSR